MELIHGVGIDLIEVPRIQRVLTKWHQRFLSRIFTQNEIEQCSKRANQAECFAARFAAKEALAKALGHGWCKHFVWTDVEVYNDPDGKPNLRIKGVTAKLVQDKRILLSLSHTKSYATAIVTVEGL